MHQIVLIKDSWTVVDVVVVVVEIAAAAHYNMKCKTCNGISFVEGSL